MPEEQNSKGWEEALRRIEKAKRSGATRLELFGLSLTVIPERVAQLSNLQTLILSGNQITAIPDSLAQLSKLKLVALGRNRLTVIPDSLARLSQLQTLDLSGNQITAIPDSFAQVSSLGSLDLSGNQITAISDSFAQISSLWSLDLSGNQIAAIPDSLAQLRNLQALILFRNQITVIPDSLAQLSNLQILHLSDNQITGIPDSLAQLSNLKTLYLGFNEITVIPDSLAQLSNLQRLDLSGNQIAAVPGSFAKLVQLEQVDLGNNRLTAVPESLADLPALTGLFLHGNPGLGAPDEVLGPRWVEIGPGTKPKPPREILAYLNKLGDARPLNEAKLIMVGQGGVGKTSLVKKLSTGEFKSGEKATEGIKISDWACRLGAKNQVTVHIWDFGGQELMHATHQFFLTQRSLYLLVLNRRQGGIDREADYWFRLIRAFGGKDAPVIVVLNKQKSEPFDVNRGGWLEKYAGNIKGFAETDCTDGKSIARLKKKIQEELQTLKSIKASFPRRWFAIKGELSHMGTQYVTFDAYREICRKYGEKDPENQASLAGFLHDLGIALNYKDDPRLRFAYVLRPEWVTEGIYALLHGFVKTKGLLTPAAAHGVLASKGYSVEATDFILGLMERFEISFPLGDRQKQVLIPQLLEDQQPDEAGKFNAAKCLNFGFEYTIVPEGLLPRFIVRTHHLSKPVTRWKSGVILHDESIGCKALVRAELTEGQVRIHIDGPEGSRRELLGIVRHNFDVIHSDYEFKPISLVYPPGVPGKPLPLNELEALARSGATSMPVVLGDSRVINPQIADLIEPVGKVPIPLKLFLSYAHEDEKYLAELQKDLKLMERKGLIQVWYDRALSAGEKWEARVLQELNNADAVVCQLSRDFLASDFCVLKELDAAIKRQEAKAAALIAYVLKECGWKEVPKLSSFQLLPVDAKPLADWKDKNKYWRAVAEGIQTALRKVQKERRVSGISAWAIAVSAHLST